MVQRPEEKLDEINGIRNLIEENAMKSNDEELNNYLGNKFEQLNIKGQVISPPLIHNLGKTRRSK